MRASPSAITSFLRCEYLWLTKHVQRVEVMAESGPRARGTFFHGLLEHALKLYASEGRVLRFDSDEGNEAVRSVAAAIYKERGILLDEYEVRECIAAADYQLGPGQFDLASWEVVHMPDGRPCIEVFLEAPLDGTPHVLSSKLDFVGRKKGTGLVCHVDFKSSKDNLKKPRHVDRDYQLLIGRHLLAVHGVHVDASMLCYTRSVAPTQPSVVYKGKANEGLSLAANQPCDWETYRAAVLARGESPDDPKYAPMADKLKDNVFQRWTPDDSPSPMVAAMMEQLYRILDRMDALAAGAAEPMRSFGHTCPKCDYDQWCSAGMGKPEGYDLVQLNGPYKLGKHSPLTRPDTYEPPDPDANYVAFLRRVAPHLPAEPLTEFKP
jgi:hypothetical protein